MPEGGTERKVALFLWSLTWATVVCGAVGSSLGAGLAIPDWPGSFGYVPFFLPLRFWIPVFFSAHWDIFWAQAHRVLGWLTLVVALVWAGLKWRQSVSVRERIVHFLPAAAVAVQACLGGARVLTKTQVAAQVLACTAPLVVLTMWFVLYGRPSRSLSPQGPVAGGGRGRAIVFLLVFAWIYAQIVFGAQLRHVSPETSPFVFSLWVWVHVLSAVGLGLVGIVFVWSKAEGTWGQKAKEASDTNPAQLLGALLVAQVMLGAVNWLALYGVPRWFVDIFASWQLALTGKGVIAVSLSSVHSVMGVAALVLSASALHWQPAVGRAGSGAEVAWSARGWFSGVPISPPIVGVGSCLAGLSASAPLHPSLEFVLQSVCGVGSLLLGGSVIAEAFSRAFLERERRPSGHLRAVDDYIQFAVGAVFTFVGFAFLTKSVWVVLTAAVVYGLACLSFINLKPVAASWQKGRWWVVLFNSLAWTSPLAIGAALAEGREVLSVTLVFLILCLWQICFHFACVWPGSAKGAATDAASRPLGGQMGVIAMCAAVAQAAISLWTGWFVGLGGVAGGGLVFLAVTLVVLVAGSLGANRGASGSIRLLWGLHGTLSYVAWILIFLPR